MVYHSEYHILLWFTMVNITIYYGSLWWISQFTMHGSDFKYIYIYKNGSRAHEVHYCDFLWII